MKFTSLKLKRNNLLSPKSLRPVIFNVDGLWFASLGLFLLILIATALIGFRLFYSQYFETYKRSEPSENFKNPIDVDKLKSAIEKRNNFINKQISLPRDPSL